MESKDESKELTLKNVATSVLLHHGRILILKRSSKVGTYKGNWACVSGYIEEGETPLETAYKELSEEIGFGKDDVELIREGEQVLAEDNEILWTIHPFLFAAKKKEIVLDWEHKEYKWILLEELENYSTVPKLKETIFSVIREKDF
jgi:8-oxo-dGTP pyrophosphatase MutT (NUDIX family)